MKKAQLYILGKTDPYIDSKHWEGLFIDITSSELSRKVTIGNIYRPGRSNSNACIDNFLSPISKIIESVKQENSTLVWSGDINLNLLHINDREKIQEYFDLFSSNGLLPQITLPTRFSKKRGTLIDQIFCRLSGPITSSLSGIILTKISDHLPCFSCIDVLNTKPPKRKTVKVRVSSPEAITSFKNEVRCNIENTYFDRNLLMDPNISQCKLDLILQGAKEKHLPEKNVKFDKYKHKINPWITSGILQSIKHRDILYKQLKCTNPESIDYGELEDKLKAFSSILQRSKRTAKIMYYQNQFEKYKSDIRKTWATINELITKKSKNSDFPAHFFSNDRIITGDQDIANCFNNFFTNIGPNLAKEIPTPPNKAYTDFLRERITFSFQFSTVSTDHLLKIITKLKPKTSSGHDKISTILLKCISNEIISVLCLIINQSLSTGIFPDNLKIAKIIPIYKKEDPHLPDNYRPISLLPAISKVFEKVAFIQVYEYFTKNKLFYESQYGFRTLHSTELAALELTDQIFRHLDQKKLPLAIFLDLSKAFDTIDHSILLNKLSYYGIQGTSLMWFNSYLTNRYQYVEFNDKHSNLKEIKTGVPQGSILGPLLFIIYMNDIHTVTDKFNFVLYADDTSMVQPLCTFTSPVQKSNSQISAAINSELNLVSDWLSLNKLSLNTKKTKMMLFHYRQKDVTNLIPKLKMNGKPITLVKEFNFLGIMLDESMTWNAHINKIACKLSCAIATFRRLKRFLPLFILKTLYSSLFLPYLNYGILLWGSNFKRVLKLQKLAVRTITNARYNAHTEPIFKQHRLLKVSDIHELNILKFYFKYKNYMLPAFFHGMFELNPEPSHTYYTRHRDEPHRPLPNTTSAEISIRYVVPRLIVQTPRCITDKIHTHSLNGFSIYIKNIIYAKYSEICSIPDCYICNRV